MRSTLYEMLYGMSLYRNKFVSEIARSDALKRIVQEYRSEHRAGRIKGAFDANEVIIDLEMGEVVFPHACSIEDMMTTVDRVKFLPPEIISGAEWGVHSDLFYMATLLFCVRYNAHPFDGLQLWQNGPLKSVNDAKKYYGAPHFIFDIVDEQNKADRRTNGETVDLWENETNPSAKAYFIQTFVNGTHSFDMRIQTEDVYAFFADDEHQIEKYKLEYDGREFSIVEGFELYEKDLNEKCVSEKKLCVVVKSTKNPSVLALGNTSDDTWSVYLPDSKEIMVSPKGIAPIVKGATISIGEYLVNIV